MPTRPGPDNETPPPMPTRPRYDEETPPPMPARPESPPAPELPRRRDFDIDLMRPVAKAAPPKPAKKTVEISSYSSPAEKFGSGAAFSFNSKTKFGSSENNPEKQYSSFAEMENKIKGTKPIEIPINQLNTPTSNTQKAPIKPAKSDWLSSTLLKANVSSGPYVPKPSYFSAISAAQAAKSQGANTSTILTKAHTSSTLSKPKPASPERATSSPGRATSWLDSAVKKILSHESYAEPNQRNFTIDNDEDKKMTWLDSVAKKGPKHEYVEIKPSYQIPKKPASLSSKKYESEEAKKLDSPDVELAKVQAVVKKVPPPKPSKLEKKKEDDDELLKSQLGRLSPTKTFNTTKKDFAAKDTELLKQQLSKLGSKSNSYVKTSTNYKEQDTELLRSQLSKLGSKPVKLSPQKEKDKAEGLLALSKLKPVKAPPQKVPEKPEALRRLDDLKGNKETDSKVGKKAPPKPMALKKSDRVETQQGRISELPNASHENGSRSDLSKAPPPSSFEDKLSSILKSSTAPTLGASPLAPVSRSSTEPGLSKRKDTSGGKLTHPNKSRAKGPRRKLPKSMAQSKQDEVQPASLSVEKRVPPAIKTKSSRVPPPINAKPSLDKMKPSRNFSGEVFI